MVSIGIDLGGTNIAAGVVDESGRLLAQAQRPTKAQRPYARVIHDMALCAKEAVQRAGLGFSDARLVGVGVPGYVDQRTGVIAFCTNLGWRDVPLREELQKHLDLPVLADNDANVAGFAESVAGVSRGTRSNVFLTLGTGVGGCTIINNRIWSGAHGVAGELGHMIYDHGGILCTCGARGCFERYASATALARMGREAAEKYPESALGRMNPERINGKTVIDAARAGDEAGVSAFDEYTTHLAWGIVTIINMIDPEMIVLGGGVSRAGDFLLNPVYEKVAENRFYKTLPFGEIALATLGNEAGIIGAAMLDRA